MTNINKTGVTYKKAVLPAQILNFANILCWYPNNLYLEKVKLKDDSYFKWNPKINCARVKREQKLKDELWPKQERIGNIMLDTILNAFPRECAILFSKIMDQDYNSLELLEFNIKNSPRSIVGEPDSVLIDEKNNKILILEIKIAGSSRKYTLDQHFKYISLVKLLKEQEFFSNFQIDVCLLVPNSNLIKNTSGLEKIGDVKIIQNHLVNKYRNDFCIIEKKKEYSIDNIKLKLSELFCRPINFSLSDLNNYSPSFGCWGDFHKILQTKPINDSFFITQFEWLLQHFEEL